MVCLSGSFPLLVEAAVTSSAACWFPSVLYVFTGDACCLELSWPCYQVAWLGDVNHETMDSRRAMSQSLAAANCGYLLTVFRLFSPSAQSQAQAPDSSHVCPLHMASVCLLPWPGLRRPSWDPDLFPGHLTSAGTQQTVPACVGLCSDLKFC